ncbi:MAG: hypothetical protein HZB43_12230 [candidate division Zixibacteria bacterium]|nr:hypothetical protein [candidate division Zixibacteria bacterium]
MTEQTQDNWQIAKSALCARIRRRWTALARLNPETTDTESVEILIQSAGDDAAALFRLADQVDRRLDLAFASRARRPESVPNATRSRTTHDEFRT